MTNKSLHVSPPLTVVPPIIAPIMLIDYLFMLDNIVNLEYRI